MFLNRRNDGFNGRLCELTGSRRRFPLGKSFGVMQGRLSAQTPRGYQAFPRENWAHEFGEAHSRGLEHIEWVLDPWDTLENPLLACPDEVIEVSDSTGVRVRSVCGDFLMARPLAYGNESWEILEKLAEIAPLVGIDLLTVPCVDNSSLRQSPERVDQLAISLIKVGEELNQLPFSLALETDLPALESLEFIDSLNLPFVSINLDSGDSASLGYALEDELAILAGRISDLHIKDRSFGGPSVKLGNGDSPLRYLFGELWSGGFDGLVTVQAFRDLEGVRVLDEQLDFIEDQLSELLFENLSR